jgi:hypothetical protein
MRGHSFVHCGYGHGWVRRVGMPRACCMMGCAGCCTPRVAACVDCRRVTVGLSLARAVRAALLCGTNGLLRLLCRLPCNRARVRQVMPIIGELFRLQGFINLHSSIRETPDEFWDDDRRWAPHSRRPVGGTHTGLQLLTHPQPMRRATCLGHGRALSMGIALPLRLLPATLSSALR